MPWSVRAVVEYTGVVMRLRRCDRYLLRQMVGPFFLALAGLSLFILLNLILRLSELMVDRGIGVAQLLKLLFFWMPELIAWAIPMSALFAVFLGLGRMEHDREIMALESIGVSLRRVLRPLLIASLSLCVITFAVYNWAMPASKNAAQRTYREILFTQSVPRISANTFFTGANDQYFYVRQYDADGGSVRDVLIYDVSGQLFPQAQSQITMVTADTGIWTGEDWHLSDGKMYGFDRDGLLIFSGSFDELSIPVTQTADQIWAQSKSPSEMGIRELMARIERARTSGLPINESIVELNQRFALPLSALLFVLVAGTVSLMFGSKNRSTGIIIGLLIIGLYQGTYFWMQALGRRGALHPVAAAWIPNLLFGLIGGLLFLRVDKLASRDMWNRLRSRVPFLSSLLMLAVFSVACLGQEVPLHLQCEDLFISNDRTEIIAQGSVHAVLDDADLRADSVYLKQDDASQWRLEAAGSVVLDFAEFDLQGDRVAADISVSAQGALTRSLEASGFQGQSHFTNSEGIEQTLYFRGDSGRLSFGDDGELAFVEILSGELTTCNCCDRPFRTQPYTLRAERLLFYPDQMIVAFGLTGRLSGLSVLWLPVYVQPLADTLESPLFPAFGNSTLRGWFLKWNVPFYVSESLYGSLLFDYYSKYSELGVGVVTRYAFAGHEGRVRVYSLPAKVGDSVFEFSASHTLPQAVGWSGSGSIDMRIVGDTTQIDYGAQATGSSRDWTIQISALREVKTRNSEDEDQDNDVTDVTQRIPELIATRDAWTLGSVTIRPTLEAGRYKEQLALSPTIEALRLSGALAMGSASALTVGALDVVPRLALRATAYEGMAIGQSSSSLHTSVDAHWRDISANYNLMLVQGGSPFEFDAQVATHHLALSITQTGWATLEVAGGIDLGKRQLDPIHAQLSWDDWASWSLEAKYSLSAISLESLLLTGDWSSDRLELNWSVPFEPDQSRFGTIALSGQTLSDKLGIQFAASLDQGNLTVKTQLHGELTVKTLSLGGKLKLSNLSFDSLTIFSEYASEFGWGASATWTYRGGTPSLDALRYGLFWDIGDCLRIGIDREATEIWVYASVLAFPEAILRYAPENASIQLGD